jgi:hypothetical protein
MNIFALVIISAVLVGLDDPMLPNNMNPVAEEAVKPLRKDHEKLAENQQQLLNRMLDELEQQRKKTMVGNPNAPIVPAVPVIPGAPWWAGWTLLLISTLLPGITAFLAYMQAKKNTKDIGALSVNVDGRLTQLLEETKTAARLLGAEEERDRPSEKSKVKNVDIEAEVVNVEKDKNKK